MFAYSVFILPSDPPPSSTIIRRYKELRLLGLQTDPTSFASSYEREIKFTSETWRDRISSCVTWPNVEKVTIIATIPNKALEGQHRDDWGEMGRAETEEWIGMVAALAPNHEGVAENPTLTGITSSKEMIGRRDKVYMVLSTLVHPDHRGKGVGKRLVVEVMRWIEERCRAIGEEGIALLGVRKENMGAVKLYESAGFKFQADSGDTSIGLEDDTKWMYKLVP